MVAQIVLCAAQMEALHRVFRPRASSRSDGDPMSSLRDLVQHGRLRCRAYTRSGVDLDDRNRHPRDFGSSSGQKRVWLTEALSPAQVPRQDESGESRQSSVRRSRQRRLEHPPAPGSDACLHTEVVSSDSRKEPTEAGWLYADHVARFGGDDLLEARYGPNRLVEANRRGQQPRELHMTFEVVGVQGLLDTEQVEWIERLERTQVGRVAETVSTVCVRLEPEAGGRRSAGF